MESGSLIIDEGEKKKHLKRKPLTSASNTPVSNTSFFVLNNALEYLICMQYCGSEKQSLTNIFQKEI